MSCSPFHQFSGDRIPADTTYGSCYVEWTPNSHNYIHVHQKLPLIHAAVSEVHH